MLDDLQADAMSLRFIGRSLPGVALVHVGLPNIRWDDLRHSCATLLLSGGTYPTHVQKLLGYASLQLTLDRYSHWIPLWASTPRARLGRL